MGGPADESVGVGGEGVMDIVPGQGHPATGQDRREDIVHHLAIGATYMHWTKEIARCKVFRHFVLLVSVLLTFSRLNVKPVLYCS